MLPLLPRFLFFLCHQGRGWRGFVHAHGGVPPCPPLRLVADAGTGRVEGGLHHPKACMKRQSVVLCNRRRLVGEACSSRGVASSLMAERHGRRHGQPRSARVSARETGWNIRLAASSTVLLRATTVDSLRFFWGRGLVVMPGIERLSLSPSPSHDCASQWWFVFDEVDGMYRPAPPVFFVVFFMN